MRALALDPKKIEIPLKGTYKLKNIRRALALLQHPERGRKTILVAGTNGKGSVCAYWTHLARAAGIKVGTYISPHILSRAERICLDGKPVSEFLLRSYERRYARILKPLTYFERMTALAFLIFRDQKVELQVLEVGMGGRLDATNLSSPDISVISRIDWDHAEILGNSLAKIAAEKAGIMRRGRNVFVSNQPKIVQSTLKTLAKQKGALLETADPFHFAEPIEKALKKKARLQGEHQAENARVALASFLKGAKVWKWKLSNSKIAKSLEEPLWMARIQIFRKHPLILIDGAHNLNSIDALLSYLSISQSRSMGKFEIVFGMMRGKEVESAIEKLRPLGKYWYLPSYYKERQIPPTELQKLIGKGSHLVSNFSKLWDGLLRGRKPVLVVGSLYLAGAVLRELRKRDGSKA